MDSGIKTGVRVSEEFLPSSGTRFITHIFGGDTATPRWKPGREGTVSQHRATCEHNNAGNGQ